MTLLHLPVIRGGSRVAVALVMALSAAAPRSWTQEVVPETNRTSRSLSLAILGTIGGGLVGYALASTQNPPAYSVAVVGAIGGGIAGWLIGKQFDQLHQAQFHGVRPLSLRNVMEEIDAYPTSVSATDTLVAVGASDGVHLFLSGASLVPTGRRAGGLLGIATVDITPTTEFIALGSPNGLYLFPPAHGRGALVSAGSVAAVVGTADRVYFASGEQVRVVAAAADSERAWLGASLSAPVRALTLDAARDLVWAITDRELIALQIDGDSLVRLGAAPIQGGARRVAVSQRRAAVTVGERGVEMFDVSDPTQPRATKPWTTARFAYDVSLDGDRMFVAAGPEGVYVVEFRDERMVTLGLARSLGFASAITSHGGYTYLLDNRTNSIRRFLSTF